MKSFNLRFLLTNIKAKLNRLLGDNLVGIYLHGSLVLGGFDDNSDVDFIAVVNDPLSFEMKKKLMKITFEDLWSLSPEKGLELHVILSNQAKHITTKPNFEFHFSKYHLKHYLDSPSEYIKKMHGFDLDLIAHVKVINQCGVALIGPNPEDVFETVSDLDYWNAVKYDIDFQGQPDNPSNEVLNLCRTLAFLKKGNIYPKIRSAYWVINNYPSFSAEVIRRCIDSRSSANGTINDREIIEVAKQLLSKVKEESA
ncbi:aminoglycoside adenylyltransferase domain-containing protein [Lentilactobacillus sp. Marseille-Q4993]|uniref:aminoglycoside adenylyltransferase domain-containing protein n=1 Tax=Lentilactobacillus sp. Marseille-Q4993 TaxID=3039492 RepID=UPI0024BC2BD1|nr:aminoglycoside adenylyltransferase domain-containing protein [Lentilactobacillus sp. Marseille-Q4993]